MTPHRPLVSCLALTTALLILACSTSKTESSPTGEGGAHQGGEPTSVEAGDGAGGNAGGSGAVYQGPDDFEPSLIPFDPTWDLGDPAQIFDRIEFLDPSGALGRTKLKVEELAASTLRDAPEDVVEAWSIEPSGALSDWIYARVTFATEQEPDSSLDWWTQDSESGAWFVQSSGRVSADGKQALFALSHLSKHGVALSQFQVLPPYSDKVTGKCEDYRSASVEGVHDAEGALHTGACGYTKFIPLFAGYEQKDFLGKVENGDLPPPFQIESSTGDPEKDGGRFCKKAKLNIKVGGKVSVSLLDWQHGLPEKTACAKEWARLRNVIIKHENRHVKDAREVASAAQRSLPGLSPAICAASERAALEALGPLVQEVLEIWFKSIKDDWDQRQAARDAAGDECNLNCDKCKDPCDPKLTKGDFSKCRFSGTGTSVSAVMGSADVSWSFSRLEGDAAVVLTPTGTASFSLPSSLPCTASPATHPLSSDDGELKLDYSTEAPTYSGGGITTWPITLTCNFGGEQGGGGPSDASVAWFWPEMGQVLPYVPGEPVSGTRTVGDQTSTWNFAPE